MLAAVTAGGLPRVDGLQGRGTGEVLGVSALVCAAVIAIRFACPFIQEEAEELKARLVASRAAIERLDELAADEAHTVNPDTLERVRGLYVFGQRRFKVRAGLLEDDGTENRSLAYRQLMRELSRTQRRALVELRASGEISNDVMHRLERERELDLEETRLA